MARARWGITDRQWKADALSCIQEERTGGEALREELREARGQLEVALSRYD